MGLGDSVRAVCAGGVSANNLDAINTIDYINVMSGGDATDFGDLTQKGWSGDGAGVSNAHGGLG